MIFQDLMIRTGKKSITICVFGLLMLFPMDDHGFAKWGFFGHKKINLLAIYTLPQPLLGFYKIYEAEVVEMAINADKRRYVVDVEAPKHYIDLDDYDGELPKYWSDAIEEVGEDSLMAKGILPWNVNSCYYNLVRAMADKNHERVLKLSADLGHYVADAHVPLHTTKNYNGQLTNQYGIHGLWESRLPELFLNDYNLFVGRAKYVNDVQNEIWEVVHASHAKVDSVLSFERSTTEMFGDHKKYSYSTRGKGKQLTKQYSEPFSKAYHGILNGMIERRMRAAVHTVGSLWYSAWIDAGQPELQDKKRANLELLKDSIATKDEVFVRPHEH